MRRTARVSGPSSLDKKRLEKISGAQYGLLHEFTERGPVDHATLDAAIAGIVGDRFHMARSFPQAARALSKSNAAPVRRSAVSRAYDGVYQAARATLLSKARRDEGDHEKLGKDMEGLKGLPATAGTVLKELRVRRDEFDYSPYPGPSPRAPYDEDEIEAIIKESIRQAQGLVRMFQDYLKKDRE